MAGDIANAGFATAIMLSPLAAITFGENLLTSSAMSVWSSMAVLCKRTMNLIFYSNVLVNEKPLYLCMLSVTTYVIDIILPHVDFLFLTTDLQKR